MRNVDELTAEIDECVAGLYYLVKVNDKWKAELPSIDPSTRPQGYANHLEALRQQAASFDQTVDRLTALKAAQWLSSLKMMDSPEKLEALKSVLQAASRAVTKRLKELGVAVKDDDDKPAKEAPELF